MLESLRQAAVFAHPAAFWVTFAILLGVSGFVLHMALRGFWRLRLITDTPTAKIRSAPQGYVELTGRALSFRGGLTAGLTGLPCLWYRFKVEEKRHTGKSNHWVTLEKGESDTPFLLDDGTGRCVVEPAGAELHCRGKDTWYGTNRRAPRPLHRSWLHLGGRYRLTEERIHEQDPIYLLGNFETPRRGPEEKERLKRGLLSTWKRDSERMASFDKDGDGRVSLEEWEVARVKAQQVADHAESRLRAEPPLSRVTGSNDSRQPFVIATFDSDTLVRRLSLQAIGGTAVFVILVAGLGFALIARLIQG